MAQGGRRLARATKGHAAEVAGGSDRKGSRARGPHLVVGCWADSHGLGQMNSDKF
jgi:hypothetical protein